MNVVYCSYLSKCFVDLGRNVGTGRLIVELGEADVVLQAELIRYVTSTVDENPPGRSFLFVCQPWSRRSADMTVVDLSSLLQLPRVNALSWIVPGAVYG